MSESTYSAGSEQSLCFDWLLFPCVLVTIKLMYCILNCWENCNWHCILVLLFTYIMCLLFLNKELGQYRGIAYFPGYLFLYKQYVKNTHYLGWANPNQTWQSLLSVPPSVKIYVWCEDLHFLPMLTRHTLVTHSPSNSTDQHDDSPREPSTPSRLDAFSLLSSLFFY